MRALIQTSALVRASAHNPDKYTCALIQTSAHVKLIQTSACVR